MKTKVLCFWIAILLAISAANLPVYAVQPASSSTVEENFYQQLADLVAKDDYSKFFGEMELQIGSNILMVDGEEQIMDVAPEITNNRTMLPIRAVIEAAGANVDWVPATSSVLIESASGDMISFTIGSNTIKVNDLTFQMDVTPYVKQNRTYMPVRVVAEALELEVEWDAATPQIVRLTAPYQCARLIVLADQLDTQGFDAETIISDGAGMWVLQFATPTQTKKAAEVLEAKGIVFEPDRYIPPIEENTGSELTVAGTHYSWGAEDCGFDSFVSKYASLFADTGVVAVVDTGVDSTHPFLQGRVLSGGYDFIDGDSTPNDGHSHGTHVAGTIIDCVGSAPISILPVRVLNNQGEGTSLTVIAGIKYAADHGADVINLSLGGGCTKAEDDAISYAIGKGCLVVAAAGNDNEDTVYSCPAHITTGGMIVVSAGDSNHNKAYFSNYGSSVDLMAPGVSIKATVPGGSFGVKSGTSMATPHAAAAAMLIDLAWGKTLTPAALEQELYSATTYGKWINSTIGAGFLDLSKASAPSKSIVPAISLDHSSLSLKVGESQTLKASVTPSDATISWSSSNTRIVTVNNGKVTATAPGSASITAKIAYDGKSYSAFCTITVTGEISEWTTTILPEKEGYQVETKVQYRFRNKELTQSSQSSLSGWTLYDTKTDTTWSNWSGWTDGILVTDSDSIQLETRQTEETTTKYYNLYYYKYWNSNYNKYYYTYSASYATARGGTKYTVTALASACTPGNSYSGHQAYSYNGFDLWWIESAYNVITSGQQYRTRTKTETTTYYYYKWSDWSEWRDISMTASDNVQVETRLLYRYVPVR